MVVRDKEYMQNAAFVENGKKKAFFIVAQYGLDGNNVSMALPNQIAVSATSAELILRLCFYVGKQIPTSKHSYIDENISII